MGMFGSSAAGAAATPMAPAAPADPSFFQLAAQMLAHGGTPDEASLAVRQRAYQSAMLQQMPQVMQRFYGLFGGSAPQAAAPAPDALSDPNATQEDLQTQEATGIRRAIGSAPQAPSPQAAAPQAAPMSGGIDLSDPNTQETLAVASMFHIPGASEMLDIAKAATDARKLQEVAIGPDGRTYRKFDPRSAPFRFASPTVINGTIKDVNAPSNMNTYTPAPPTAGATPVYDAHGNIVDWNIPAGVRNAINLSQTPGLMRGQAALAEAAVAARNAGTSAGALANTTSQNTVAPPAGFTVRPRRR